MYVLPRRVYFTCLINNCFFVKKYFIELKTHSPQLPMEIVSTTTRLSRAHQCLQWCSERRRDMPSSAKDGASPYTFLESVTPFDHGVFDYGIGLKAARDLTKDEQLCSLPTRWAWSSRVAMTDPNIGPMLRELEGKIRTDDLIAIKLAYHRSIREISPWYAHVQNLPETYDSILFWTKEQRSQLKGTNTFQLATVLSQQVQSDYLELRTLLCPKISDEEDEKLLHFFTLENYQWALGTLWSRGHDFIRGSNEQFRCMLPGIDLLNMATPEKPANVEVRLVGNRVDLVCIQSVQEGDELRAVYNRNLPNSRLLHLHGFIVSPNPLSFVELHCGLSPQAPLYQYKIKELRKVITPYKLKLNDPFHLTLENPIPKELLLTLSLQRASTEKELRTISETTRGSFVPNADIVRELILALTQMLANYQTTESTDEDILQEQQMETEEAAAELKVGKRRLRLATRLRYDEKQILRKGMEMLMEMLSNSNNSEEDSENESDTEDVDE